MAEPYSEHRIAQRRSRSTLVLSFNIGELEERAAVAEDIGIAESLGEDYLVISAPVVSHACDAGGLLPDDFEVYAMVRNGEFGNGKDC